jgi:hypothetical protein
MSAQSEIKSSIYFLLVAGFWLIYFGLILLIAVKNDALSIATMGQAGDSFGPLNALFSGLAFAALIISLHRQEQEIRQIKANNRSQKVLTEFNTLLSHHLSNISQMEISSGSAVKFQGRQVFEKLYRDWKEREFKKPETITFSQESEEGIYRLFNHFHDDYFQILHPHFHSLYYLLNYIDENTSISVDGSLVASGLEKSASVIKTLVSSNECCLLFYYATSDHAPPEMKGLIEKYQILENAYDDPTLEEFVRKKFTANALGKNPMARVE